MIEAKWCKLMEGTIKLPTPIVLTPAQLEANLAVLRKGNSKLRECAESFGMDHREFRKNLFKVQGKIDSWPGITSKQVTMIQLALPDINAVRKLEDTMLAAFMRLILKHANAWGRRRRGPVVDFADYVQESVMAFIDGLYAYTLEDVKFVTFIWNIIRNRCSSASNRNHPLNPLTNEALALMQRFESEKRKLAMAGPASDEDVIQAMQVDRNQAEIIRSSLVRVIHSSQFNLKDASDEDQIDFLCRVGHTNYLNTASYEDENIGEYDDLYEAIKKAELTPEEHEALRNFMYEDRGWQTRMAEELRKQGRHMTRAGISFRVRGAIEKVKAVLMRNRQKAV